MIGKIISWFYRSEGKLAFISLRQGLAYTTPVLLIGSFCLVILNFPVPSYQEFIAGGPFLIQVLEILYQATMGILPLYVSAGIAIAYARIYEERYSNVFAIGAPFASVGSYLILCGFGNPGFTIEVLGSQSLFIAVICGLGAAALYCTYARRTKNVVRYTGTTGDRFFDHISSSVPPITLIVLLAALINTAAIYIFPVTSFEALVYAAINSLFSPGASILDNSVLYVFLGSVFWFFGFHGANMFEGAAQALLVPGTQENAALIASGMDPINIMTKAFLDAFVFIGGAGALISLLLAIFFFGRRRSIRRLGYVSTIPTIFNINETLLFGLPIVWNPVLGIPFILVPLVNLCISYFATVFGLVPYVTVDVSWTTPPILGGYLVTGSIAGSILQIVNIIIGMFIYLPFLRFYEKVVEGNERNVYEKLFDRLRQSETRKEPIVLTDLSGRIGSTARTLANDLEYALEEGALEMYFQPQFDTEKKIVGAESLLRWKHPTYGMIYPPLVVKLADEKGILVNLEKEVLRMSLDAAERIKELIDEKAISGRITVSVNVSATFLQNGSSVSAFLAEYEQRDIDPRWFIIEATEQDALVLDDSTYDILTRLSTAGVDLAIDDFSMGHASYRYLESSIFDFVKLDGGLVKGIMDNKRFAAVVASIARLAAKLDLIILAEFVETDEQMHKLKEMGCVYFQGYLVSPAVPFDDFIAAIKRGHDS